MRSCRVIVLCLSLLLCSVSISPVYAQESLPDIVERISPSVVVILTYDEAGEAVAQGSGFFVNDLGDVITNFHVIEGASSLDIMTSDGDLHPVTAVLAEDKDGDLAVLDVNMAGETVQALSVNSALPRTAESIIVIGCPRGLELTVSDGIVSAVRHIDSFGKMIQITAPISPGSSGGPVIDVTGKVIGVAQGTIVDGQNLNFAIPSERVSELIASVLRSAPIRSMSDPIPKLDAAESLYQEGLKFVWAEDYESALPKFQQATRIKPELADAFFYIGYCNGNLGRTNEALQAFEEVIRLTPNDSRAWRNKGGALFMLGRFNESLEAYERAIQLKPDDALAWSGKGAALFMLERSEEALEAYETAIRIKPDKMELRFNKGWVLVQLGRYDEAIQAYDAVIQLKPSSAEAWCEKGTILNDLGRYSEALQAYERAIELRQDYAIAWYNKGGTLSNLGRHAQALLAYDKAIQLKPDYAEAWYNKGVSLEELGRQTEAGSAFERSFQLNPDLR